MRPIQGKILVVEDSPSQALVLWQMLEDSGLEVLWAPNGRIGVRMARRHLPNAIVMDIEMPEMNGLEACKKLKEDPETAPIPVIVLTGRVDPEIMVEGIDYGAIDFIPKDAFFATVLMETLRQMGVVNQPAEVAS